MTVTQASSPNIHVYDAEARLLSQADETEAYAEAALSEAKQEGMRLAVRARWIGLAVVAIMLPFLNPNWPVLYYPFLLCLFALIGWAQLKVAQVGQSRAELFLIFCDLALMTIVTVVPNPFVTETWPTAVQYRFGAFIWFFMLLAGVL